MVCPLNGARPVTEFAYGGEVRPGPDPDTCSDTEWSRHVFDRSGSPGIKYEWWCHIASGFWFVALRDTACDRVIQTYAAERVRCGLPERQPLERQPTEQPPAFQQQPFDAQPVERAPSEREPLDRGLQKRGLPEGESPERAP
jgi:sarcosine oxidase subunit delta